MPPAATTAKPPPAPPEVIETLKCIAAHLGIAETTALAYSRLNEDPLPLRQRRGTLRAYRLHIDEWKRRRSGGEGLARFEGWAAICSALGGVNKDTAIQWARLRHDRLPVLGMGTEVRTGRPWIYAAALRDWIYRHDLPVQTIRLLRGTTNPARDAATTGTKPNRKRVAA